MQPPKALREKYYSEKRTETDTEISFIYPTRSGILEEETSLKRRTN
jgi:hypothetical protein